MRCAASTLVLTLTTLLGTAMYIGAGWQALDQTLALFEAYGPSKGNGNPALDDPPEPYINPKTAQYEVHYNRRGNLVPQVFKGVKYYLISLAIFMSVNSLLFMYDSVRSKKFFSAGHVTGFEGKTPAARHSRITCTGWLAGYSVFIALMWLVMACFGVLPLLQWRITMQRCWDLNNPKWSPGTERAICVDLVQYGLVFFKETSNAGFAMICGPSGSYEPDRGDLTGLCAQYYPTFSLYMVSFAGACIAMISMIMFAIRHATNFVYLKFHRWEALHNAGAAYPPPQPRHVPGQYASSAPGGFPAGGGSMFNPNYERNVLAVSSPPPGSLPPAGGVDSIDGKFPCPDREMEMHEIRKERPYARYDDQASHTGSRTGTRKSKKYRSRPSSYGASEHDRTMTDSRPPTADPRYDPDEDEMAMTYDDKRRPDGSSDGKGRAGDASQSPVPSTDDDDDDDERPLQQPLPPRGGGGGDFGTTRSVRSYRPRQAKRRSGGSRSARSETDLSRNRSATDRHPSRSNRPAAKQQLITDEYDSPPSDFYIQQDAERRRSRRQL